MTNRNRGTRWTRHGQPAERKRRPKPQTRPLGAEYRRLLAERERLIAEGADPAELPMPERPA